MVDTTDGFTSEIDARGGRAEGRGEGGARVQTVSYVRLDYHTVQTVQYVHTYVVLGSLRRRSPYAVRSKSASNQS
jgi:hypothetical protein